MPSDQTTRQSKQTASSRQSDRTMDSIRSKRRIRNRDESDRSTNSSRSTSNHNADQSSSRSHRSRGSSSSKSQQKISPEGSRQSTRNTTAESVVQQSPNTASFAQQATNSTEMPPNLPQAPYYNQQSHLPISNGSMNQNNLEFDQKSMSQAQFSYNQINFQPMVQQPAFTHQNSQFNQVGAQLTHNTGSLTGHNADNSATIVPQTHYLSRSHLSAPLSEVNSPINNHMNQSYPSASKNDASPSYQTQNNYQQITPQATNLPNKPYKRDDYPHMQQQAASLLKNQQIGQNYQQLNPTDNSPGPYSQYNQPQMRQQLANSSKDHQAQQNNQQFHATNYPSMSSTQNMYQCINQPTDNSSQNRHNNQNMTLTNNNNQSPGTYTPNSSNPGAKQVPDTPAYNVINPNNLLQANQLMLNAMQNQNINKTNFTPKNYPIGAQVANIRPNHPAPIDNINNQMSNSQISGQNYNQNNLLQNTPSTSTNRQLLQNVEHTQYTNMKKSSSTHSGNNIEHQYQMPQGYQVISSKAATHNNLQFVSENSGNSQLFGNIPQNSPNMPGQNMHAAAMHHSGHYLDPNYAYMQQQMKFQAQMQHQQMQNVAKEQTRTNINPKPIATQTATQNLNFSDENEFSRRVQSELQKFFKSNSPQTALNVVNDSSDQLSSISLKKSKSPRSDKAVQAPKNIGDNQGYEQLIDSINSASNFNSHSSDSLTLSQSNRQTKKSQKQLVQEEGLARYKSKQQQIPRSKTSSNVSESNQSNVVDKFRHSKASSKSSPHLMSTSMNDMSMNLTRLFHSTFHNGQSNSSANNNASLHQVHAIGWNMIRFPKSFSPFSTSGSSQSLYYSQAQQLRHLDNRARFQKFGVEKEICTALSRHCGPFDGLQDCANFEESTSFCELKSNEIIKNYDGLSLDRRSTLALWSLLKFGSRNYARMPKASVNELETENSFSKINEIMVYQNKNFDKLCPVSKNDLTQLFFNYFKDLHYSGVCQIESASSRYQDNASSNVVYSIHNDPNLPLKEILLPSVDPKLIYNLIEGKRHISIDEFVVNSSFDAVSFSVAYCIDLFNKSNLRDDMEIHQSSVDTSSAFHTTLTAYLAKQADQGYVLLPIVLSLLSGHMYCSADDLGFSSPQLIIKFWPLLVSLLLSCCNCTSSMPIAVNLLKSIILTLESDACRMPYSALLCKIVLLLLSPEQFINGYEAFMESLLAMEFLTVLQSDLTTAATSSAENHDQKQKLAAKKYALQHHVFQNSLHVAELTNLIVSRHYQWLLDTISSARVNQNQKSLPEIWRSPKLCRYNSAKLIMAFKLHKYGYTQRSYQYINSLFLTYDSELFAYDRLKSGQIDLWLQIIDLGLSLCSMKANLDPNQVKNHKLATLKQNFPGDCLQADQERLKRLLRSAASKLKYLITTHSGQSSAQNDECSTTDSKEKESHEIRNQTGDQEDSTIRQNNDQLEKDAITATSSPISSTQSNSDPSNKQHKTPERISDSPNIGDQSMTSAREVTTMLDSKLADNGNVFGLQNLIEANPNGEVQNVNERNDVTESMHPRHQDIAAIQGGVQGNNHVETAEFDINNVFVVGDIDPAETVPENSDQRSAQNITGANDAGAESSTQLQMPSNAAQQPPPSSGANSVKDFYRDSNPFMKSSPAPDNRGKLSLVEKLKQSVTGLVSSNGNKTSQPKQASSQFNGGIPECDPNLLPPAASEFTADLSSRLNSQAQSAPADHHTNYVNYFDF